MFYIIRKPKLKSKRLFYKLLPSNSMHSEKWTPFNSSNICLSNNKNTAQKITFSIRISSVNVIWSHWLKQSLMENFIFCVVELLKREQLTNRPLTLNSIEPLSDAENNIW